MRVLFFVLVLLFLFLANWYIAYRGWQALSLMHVFRHIYVWTVVLLFISIFFTLFLGHLMPVPLGKVIGFLAYTYMVVFIYLLFSFLFVDILRAANSLVQFIYGNMIVFRQWAMFVSLFIIGVLLLLGNYKFNHPEVVYLKIKTEKVAQEKKIRAVVVSDLHLGFLIDKSRLRTYVNLINQQNPDLVLIVGDVTDRNVAPVIKQQMKEELRMIKSHFGVFAINGNHEYFAENSHITEDYLREAGIHFLRDSTALIDNSIYIIGRDDRINKKRTSLRALLNSVDKSKFLILMDHQPFNLHEAEQYGIDVQFSGHTHNGQFFPGNLIVNLMYELGHGYQKRGNTHYYVSSGLGLWGPPYRIGTQSELVVVDIEY